MNDLEALSRPADLRVVLAGANDLERSLRRDAAIELVRSRTALDAVGEAASPMDEHSPVRTAVVVAPGAISEAESGAFVAAVKDVAQGAIVLAVGEPHGDRGSYDGLVGADADSVMLRRVIERALDTGIAAEGAECETPKTESVPAAQEEQHTSVAETLASSDERGGLEAILSGGDVVEAALASLRSSYGDPGLRLVDQGDEGAVVERRGVIFGWLVGDRIVGDELAEAAARLALWAAVGAQQAQLRRAAFTDSLTGAWNRRYLERFLPAAIEHARQSRHDLTLLLFDIDEFKQYNDAFGHAAGDEILKETVRLLTSLVRPTDRVCRLGGDEFVVVFNEPRGPRQEGSRHPMSISEIASRFQRAICERKFPKLGTEAASTLTISGGMTTFPWDGANTEALLERADQLALASKRQGKNVITLGPGAERRCGPMGFDTGLEGGERDGREGGE